MKDRWALVTDDGDGQSRTALVTARALARGGYRVAATVSARRSLAGASRSVSHKVPMVPVEDERYPGLIAQERSRRGYVATFPTSDAALRHLGFPSLELLDKSVLQHRGDEVGLTGPPTRIVRSPEELGSVAHEVGFPFVIKPFHSTMRPLRVATSEELQALPDLPDKILVQPYLRGEMKAVAGVIWEGRLVAAVHQRYMRNWPGDIGGACAAVTAAPDEGLEAGLVQLLRDHTGIFMAQLIDGHLIDLNPRVYGSLPLAVAAGANLPSIVCDLLGGRTIKATIRAREGSFFRWLEGDLRHLAARVRRGELGAGAALRELRPRKRAAHPVGSWRDPGPQLARLAYALTKQS